MIVEIRIQNQKLVPAINLLFGLSLKGKQSRHRSKFVNQLRECLKDFAEDEKAMRKEECHLDEEGEPKTYKKNGIDMLDVIDIRHFEKIKKELDEEERFIEGADKQTTLQTIKKILDNLDKELSGADAETYDYLLDQFEAAEAEDKKKACAE